MRRRSRWQAWMAAFQHRIVRGALRLGDTHTDTDTAVPGSRNVAPLSRSSGLGINEGTFLSGPLSRHPFTSVALSTKLEAPFRLKRLGPGTNPIRGSPYCMLRNLVRYGRVETSPAPGVSLCAGKAPMNHTNMTRLVRV